MTFVRSRQLTPASHFQETCCEAIIPELETFPKASTTLLTTIGALRLVSKR